MKKILLFLLLFLFLIGCDQTTGPTSSLDAESVCKDTPLSTACFLPSERTTSSADDIAEYTIEETFESERLNQIPSHWLLYSNEEYKAGGVSAKVMAEGENQFVQMYSDGLQKPPYPQNAPTPTFIFTTKFNLDLARKGTASIDVLVPSVGGNAVSVGLSTGAVNTVSVTVDADRSVFVKVGGPFYYYSLNNDGGDRHNTAFTLENDTWYTFRFEWDATLNLVKAFLIDGETENLLFSGPFHISNRINANATAEILVPNVVRVTMPYNKSGFAAIDNIIVERKAD